MEPASRAWKGFPFFLAGGRLAARLEVREVRTWPESFSFNGTAVEIFACGLTLADLLPTAALATVETGLTIKFLVVTIVLTIGLTAAGNKKIRRRAFSCFHFQGCVGERNSCSSGLFFNVINMHTRNTIG